MKIKAMITKIKRDKRHLFSSNDLRDIKLISRPADLTTCRLRSIRNLPYLQISEARILYLKKDIIDFIEDACLQKDINMEEEYNFSKLFHLSDNNTECKKESKKDEEPSFNIKDLWDKRSHKISNQQKGTFSYEVAEKRLYQFCAEFMKLDSRDM